MELHDHSHLHDAHRDEDVFVILSWSLSRAFLKPPSHHVRHLYVVMLLIPRDASLTFGFDLDYGDHTFHVIRFSTYHISDAILGHIPFQMRFMDLHGIARSSPLMGYTSRRGPVRYFIVILQWSPSWVVHPNPHLSALRCHCTSPSEMCLFYL